jgi:outer membrane murein-binding lipoprotein Lpp
MVLAGCQQGSNPEAQRIDQLNLKIEQLEQRLNKLASERRAGSGSQVAHAAHRHRGRSPAHLLGRWQHHRPALH